MNEEEERRRHEYLLMEMRLGNEDVKEFVRESIKPIEKRVSKLEHWRTSVHAMGATVIAVFSYLYGRK